MNPPRNARDALGEIWRDAELPEEALARIRFSGSDPVLPSSFAVGTAAAASIGAAALGAATLFSARGGADCTIAIALRDAAIEFRSERYLEIDHAAPPPVWDAIAGLYPTADGWVRLHTNFPHHRDGILRLLGVAHDRAEVARALKTRKAEEFAREATEAGLPVAWLRDFEAWDRSHEGRAVALEPLIAIERIGDAAPQPLVPAREPLGGFRVLDLSRVVAGPIAARTLARYGAEVLAVTARHLPQIPALAVETGRGKLTTFLDLRETGDVTKLENLLADADVFLDAYRPGALSAHGFGARDAARIRPGIVYAHLSAYGFTGPWAGRRGFDSIVQTGTGFNAAEAKAAGAGEPKPLPAQVLDYASGHLLAFGVVTALLRRAREGGSWRVSVSLARTGLWLRSLGRLSDGFACPDPDRAAVAERLEEVASGFGPLTVVRAAAVFEPNRLRPMRPAMPLGTHPPRFSL